MDNTFGAGGYYVRPIEHGADVVVHSATKWIGGHGTTVAGVLVDGGQFDWGAAAARFPAMVSPSPAYHGLRPWATFGPATLATRARIELQRDLGACLSPFAAQQLLLGLETLSLRADRHAANARALAAHLQAHAAVRWVAFAGLPEHPAHALARRYLRPGCFGGVLSFGVRGGAAAGRAVVDRLRLVSNLANVGDAKSLAIHPWSTTHEQLAEPERRAAGVSDDLIRISVGIEHIDDIIADFDQALRAAVPESAADPAVAGDNETAPAADWI